MAKLLETCLRTLNDPNVRSIETFGGVNSYGPLCNREKGPSTLYHWTLDTFESQR